jgi:hypothetical protein
LRYIGGLDVENNDDFKSSVLADYQSVEEDPSFSPSGLTSAPEGELLQEELERARQKLESEDEDYDIEDHFQFLYGTLIPTIERIGEVGREETRHQYGKISFWAIIIITIVCLSIVVFGAFGSVNLPHTAITALALEPLGALLLLAKTFL